MDKMNLDPNNMPKHVAIIMDGNGRWAKQRGMERVFGHREGTNAVRRIVRACGELQIPYLTLYAFSTENWNRPKAEVDALMTLLVQAIHDEVPELNRNRVRLNAIGHLTDLPQQCQEALSQAIADTAGNTGLTLTLSLSYSGRNELTRCMKAIAESVATGEIAPADIDEKFIAGYLDTALLPDPDILIRTGGEQRVSNFLLWQIAYAELFFSPVLWPDFDKAHLLDIIAQYQNRERRYGKTSEQIKAERP